ncbi:MAG: transposase [Firmicutes bacterium]|nr:transposase [Bacillota bacterium]
MWALLPNPLLGVAKIGRRLAVATRRPAKSAMKRVDRFLGNPRLEITVAQADLIQTLLADATEALLTRDWTDPHDGVHQILALNVRAHGRALPLAWRTVCKAALAGQMRAMEIALCQQAAAAIPPDCHVILLADRGFAAPTLFAALTRLGWEGIIRAPGQVQGRRQGLWRWADQRPVLRDLPHIRHGSRRAGTLLPCRAVIAADRQHREPWFLIVSAGLTPDAWPAARIVAAYRQRWTTEGALKMKKMTAMRAFASTVCGSRPPRGGIAPS